MLIWLDVDAETVLARGRARDVAWVGSEDVVIQRYQQWVIPTQTLYEQEVRPGQSADIV